VTETSEGVAILLETDDLVFVDKPAGIATEPDAKNRGSLRDELTAVLAERGPSTLVHALSRLDLPVSGVVTFAKHSSRALDALIQSRRVRKLYVAIVLGDLDATRVVENAVDGKPATTRLTPIARASHSNGAVTLLVAEPLTGRFHQIRAHSAAIEHPVVGERRHGDASRLITKSGRVLAPGRLLLHSLAVVVPWPEHAPPSAVVAPVPSTFRETWSALDGEAQAWENVKDACDDWLQRQSSA